MTKERLLQLLKYKIGDKIILDVNAESLYLEIHPQKIKAIFDNNNKIIIHNIELDYDYLSTLTESTYMNRLIYDINILDKNNEKIFNTVVRENEILSLYYDDVVNF